MAIQKNTPKTIGILDLQGGVLEHLEHLQRLSVNCRRVKSKADFDDLAGLIIPGGESSCLSRLIKIFDLKTSLLNACEQGMKIWGTCAGAILLATKVKNEAACLGLIDMEIERNSFGSQLDSFKNNALIPQVSAEPVPLIFIRAPKILNTGKNVSVLLKIDDYIAAAESDNILVTVFHPELTGCLDFHRYFARKCGIQPVDDKNILFDSAWATSSWTKLARVACI
jgi:pyridoxal 5'-phosphate synthase pdxT subunit